MYSKNYYKGFDEKEVKKQIIGEGFDPIKISNPSGYTYTEHSHPETKLLAFLSGAMQVTIGREKYECTKGDKVIIGGGVDHSAIVGDKGCTFFWSEKMI